MGVSLSPTKIGVESMVNTTTLGRQEDSSVAALTGGGYVVIWNQNPAGGDIYGQVFAADGTKLGSEFLISNAGGPNQAPVVTALGDGGFVAAWQSFQGDAFDIQGRRFAADGTALTTVFTVSETAPNSVSPDLTLLSDGSLAAAWVSQSGLDPQFISTRIFQPDGTMISGAAGSENGGAPAVTALAGGGYAVAWVGSDGAGTGIFAQIFDANGAATGAAVQVNTTILQSQEDPSIIQLTNGNLVVAYKNYTEMSAQILSPTGERVGTEFKIHPGLNFHTDPDLLALADGGFAVAYTAGGILIQRYTADGTPLGDAVKANNPFESGNFFQSSLTQLGNGDLVVSYTHDIGGFVTDVLNNLFDLPANTAPSVTSAATANFAEDGTGIAYTATATDVNTGDTLRFSLSGDDAALFDINATSGAVTFKAAPDFEMPADAGSNNVYDIMVTATDLSGGMGSQAVAITVTDVAATLTGTPAPETLTGGIGADLIQGLGRNDTLLGLAGNDTLDGGEGADSMVGGMGDDTYMVSSRADLVIEAAGEGTDLVLSAAGRFTLADHVENLTYTGPGRFTGTGNGLDNVITGGARQDVLNGGDGDDDLMGEGGDDRLNGGAGLDFMVGGAGNDVLDGGAGADQLTGGIGNDIFRFRRGEADGDVVFDFAGNGAAAGDRLQFFGYGSKAAGATFTNVGGNSWEITSADGNTTDMIFIHGSVVAKDWVFM
jgi:serralysin